MKINKWTMGLAGLGLVSLASVAQAEETSVPLMTALSSTVISGYVDVSAVWNPGTGNKNPAPVSFNAGKQDGFNLNVVGLTLEKPLDEDTWSAGYKTELIFGPDAVNYNTSANAIFTTDNDFAVKQAYVALRAPVGNGLDFKVGVFDTPIGYESFTGYRNPNYTRSYGYTIAPTQHTGVLASYQFNEVIGVSAGVANTLSAGINARSNPPRAESSKTYMASITLTAPESMGVLAGSALYGGIVDGFNGTLGAGAANDDQTSYYVGATIATPVAGLRLGAAYDHVSEGPAGYAAATALYASFQATEKLSLHARGEYGNGAVIAGGGKVFALTTTVQYDLWQNVISRLELRWDHSANGDPAFGGTAAGVKTFANPNGANERNAVMLAANLIYKF